MFPLPPKLAGLLIALIATGCSYAPAEVIPKHVAGNVPSVRPQPSAIPTVTAVSPAEQVKTPQAITFEELDLGMTPDSVYEPWMLTTRVKVLEGKTVRITGFMSAAILQAGAEIRTFPLMREKECPFGPGGQAHHVVEVELQGKLRQRFTTEPVTVTGVFSVRPWTGPNGKTWSLYHLQGTGIE